VRAGVGQEIELQARRRVVIARDYGQAQRLQRVEQAALGRFQLVPVEAIFGNAQVGNRVRELARLAQAAGVVGRHHPVADRFHLIVVAALEARIACVGMQAAPADSSSPSNAAICDRSG
jgi:hypothetical protein